MSSVNNGWTPPSIGKEGGFIMLHEFETGDVWHDDDDDDDDSFVLNRKWWIALP